MRPGAGKGLPGGLPATFVAPRCGLTQPGGRDTLGFTPWWQREGAGMLVRQILMMKGGGADAASARKVVTIAPDASVADAAHMMADKRIGAVVVSENGEHPVGIISERDIVRELGRRGPAVLDEPVRAIMTGSIVTCVTGDDALSVLTRMTEGRFRHMPVVDGEGRMLGIVSIGDAVSGRLKELAAEKEALTGMIMGA